MPAHSGIRPFDRFPFPFLTMTVSLEAIFLALFVLASQNRLARQADKRSHLDLQIDLLAEREMTAVLQLLQDIARHLDVETSVTPEQLRDLMKKTDLRRLTDRMEELAEPAAEAPASYDSALRHRRRGRHECRRARRRPLRGSAFASHPRVGRRDVGREVWGRLR